MALVSTAVSEAKTKLEQAEAETQWQVGQAKAQDALQLASDGLVSARRANDAETKLSALEVVVKAQMYLGELFAANLAATDELAMIKRSGDTKSEAKALQLLSEVQTARGDNVGAADNLQKAMALHKDANNKVGQAKALELLAKAKLAANKPNDALASAQDAVKLFAELGDREGETSATRTVNIVFAAKNQLDKAPGRPEALQALKDLSTAIDERDTQRWTGAMEELNRTGAYTQKDVDSIVSSALEKDRVASATFLEDQGIVVKGSGAPEFQMKEGNRTTQYLNFRFGGLGYGPRFRCLTAYKGMVPDKETTLHAMGCLQVSEQAEDWETELQWHPGVLDGMLQSNTAFSL